MSASLTECLQTTPPGLLCAPPRKRICALPLRLDAAVAGFRVRHGVVPPQGSARDNGVAGASSWFDGPWCERHTSIRAGPGASYLVTQVCKWQ
ncbi:hypothetical protein ZWY2020_030196 [Hordeum vulgare]|nr:hypothetical protein ZWY2020_030196 [Hordeum vulgare]